MKKWILSILVILALFLTGSYAVAQRGHDQNQYENAVRLGKDRLVQTRYSSAETQFQAANKVDSDRNQSKNLLEATQDYVTGKSFATQQKLPLALRYYERGLNTNASSVLDRRARVMIKRLSDRWAQESRLTSDFNRALALNHQRHFKRSDQVLMPILNGPQSLAKKARDLKASNADSNWSNQFRISVEDSHWGSAGRQQLVRPVHRIPKRSVRSIKSARAAIKRAGINVSAMSDRDVYNVIKQASRAHESIYRFAKKNY